MKPDFIHAGNSATGIDTPFLTGEALRLGISLYGFYPSDEVNRERVKLVPALTWKTRIVQLKWIEDGDAVSYGATYRAQGKQRIATLPVGYADGYTRLLSNKGYVLIKGERAPIVGRVCMDQMMVNVTAISHLNVGEEVVLIGKQGQDEISAGEWAGWFGTIHYEAVCKVGMRVPRVYIENGKVIETVNRLETDRD